MTNPSARSFNDLHVFRQARELVNRVYDLTMDGSIRKDYALTDQMRRAALSTLSNIAEGFEKGTRPEFARSLYIAKGSNGELRAQALVALDRKYWPKETFEEVNDKSRRLGAGLANLIAYLKRSGPKRSGPR